MLFEATTITYYCMMYTPERGRQGNMDIGILAKRCWFRSVQGAQLEDRRRSLCARGGDHGKVTRYKYGSGPSAHIRASLRACLSVLRHHVPTRSSGSCCTNGESCCSGLAWSWIAAHYLLPTFLSLYAKFPVTMRHFPEIRIILYLYPILHFIGPKTLLIDKHKQF